MAYYKIIFYFTLIFNVIESKWIRPTNINETHGLKLKLNKNKLSDKETYHINNNKEIELMVLNKTDHPVSLSESEKKCELINQTDENFEVKHVDSIHLDNIYSVTVNLIKDKVSIDDIEVEGVNLFDVVNSNCGSAKICPNFRANWSEANTVTIGFLSAYGWSQTILGALPLAVAAVNRDPSLLPGLKLRFVTADIGRPRPPLPMDKNSLSLRIMTQMRDMGVVAFFGPDGTCHTEAKLAAAWNLPLISHKCAGAQGTGGLGSTFARTLPPAHKVSKSVVSLLKAYGWNKFAIIAGDALSAAKQQMDAIKKLSQNNGLVVTAEHRFPDYIPRHISRLESIVDQTYDKTRVYVFLGEHIALVDFVNVLQRRGLLAHGEYAVVAVDDEIYDPNDVAITHADHLIYNSSSDVLAFRAVLKLTPSYPTNPDYLKLCQMIRKLSAAPPFCVPNYHKIFDDTSVPIEAAHLYDAVTLWARAATAAMQHGLALTDGTTLMRLLRPTTYRSLQGFDVNMDNAGDAEGNFSVIGVVEDPSASYGWSAQPVAAFRYTNSSDSLPEFVDGSKIAWIGGTPPIAEPACGFDGMKCALPHDPVLLSAAAAAAAALLLAAALFVRHCRYEQILDSVLWRIEAKDLTFITTCNKDSITQEVEKKRAHTTIASYRGNIVAVKRLKKKNIDITRAIKKELKQMRELRHENLTPFVGVCVETGVSCVVTAYCSRGSLATVLADRDLHLDDMFVASLVADLLRGLTYLHESALISHGNLTSNNCLVDRRWVLQITDYGLHILKSGCVDAADALMVEKRMLWRAPELLREPSPPPRGSQRGDLYSFGIILYEILGRNGPWGDTNLTNTEIIGRVRHPIDGVLFRPPLSGLAARPSVIAVLKACWSERPDRRPDVRLVRLRLKDMHAGMKTNIFDNMLAMMEKYASNLEGLVAARTEELLLEKKRTDDLLNRMLPRTVAEALKRGEPVQAETFNCVTIYFSDIVGFTKLAATNTPMQVVEILNDLYTCCDDIISYYNVYKVETIGDAYMVVGGLPERVRRHAAEVASLALHILDAVPKIKMRHMPATRLHIRIGIHSGQCAAGVVGIKMPRYCLFGDTVNTAARMESNGEPQKIHVSHDTYKLLKKHGGYHFKERGLINIKGKGEIKTWWLVGEDHERRTNSLFRYQPGFNRTESDMFDESWSGSRSIFNIRDRARLSCGGSLGPGSALSSPGPPACACFVPPRDHHSAPAVSFYHLIYNSSSDVLAFRAVLKLTPSYPTNPDYLKLCQMIRKLSAAPPFCVPNYHKIFDDTSVPIEAAHLYDAVTLWARAATAAMQHGLALTNGTTLMRLLRPTTYRSLQGFDVNMDNAGDAEGNFSVIGVVEDPSASYGWSAQPVAAFRYTNSSDSLPEFVDGSKIAWIGGTPPIAEPACGFDGMKCALPHDPVLLSAAAAAAAALLLAAALFVRHCRYEQILDSVLWRIEAKDLTFITTCNKDSITQEVEKKRAHTTIASYRGNIVAVKRLKKKNIDITRAIKKELKQMRELRHENLTPFVGVCVETGVSCVVTAYCSRGSLATVLADRDLHLDDMFVASLVADLLRGLTYLHESALISHGNLTSNNCLVDRRWVLQITDYGLHILKSGCVDAADALMVEKRMLWRAPELLREPSPPPRGSQRGDLYSFGIILYEILGRNGPWGDTNLTNTEIIGRVRHPIDGVLFRPPLSGLAARPSVIAVLKACWSERPDRRPDVRLVRLRLKDMHAGMKTNIFDNMLAMMEKYASNLEGLVAARTEELLLEKKRTDDLLNRMLPRTVAEALKRGEPVQAETFNCVTIYFSDIVGFTKLAATNTPMQVVEILNDLYTCCDDIISYYNVYKVETIGDAYMVVGGLPERVRRHAAEVASLALHILDAVPKIKMRHMPATRLHIRIGIHSGQCAAGVVGIKMPRYCLFGDTVNTAARMESNGEPQKIHVSHDTYKLLKKHGGYHFKERGLINIKGKGEIKTWWLVGEDHERRTNSLFRYQPGFNRTESDMFDESWSGSRSIFNIRDRARLSCGGSLGPGSALSSPGPPACACFVPPRDHHSAPAVSFCED